MTIAKSFSKKKARSSVGSRKAAWAWSKFWQDDNLSACTADDDTTDGTLLREWKSFFALLNNQASVLDMGTGNGALAAIAVAFAQREGFAFDIHGCDLAGIEPRTYVKSRVKDLVDITFHAETPMESLPFADEVFNAVCGQYALEYSDTTRSVPELMRVLRSGGQLQFLLHSTDGALHLRNKLQWQQAQILLKSSLLPGTRKMLAAVVEGESVSNAATLEEGVQAITGLRKTMDQLAQALSKEADLTLPENVFSAIRRLAPMRHSYELPQLLSLVDDIEERLQAQSARLLAMLDATLDANALQRLSAQFVSLGASHVRTRPALAGSHETRVGYWLTATKL